MSKEEFLKIQTCVLKVNIHCDGCKQKVKKILQKIDGVYMIKIESEHGKVTVSGDVEPATLIKKLIKNGKHAEICAVPKPNNNQNQKEVLLNQLKNLAVDNKGGNNQPKPDGAVPVKDLNLPPQFMMKLPPPVKDQKNVKFEDEEFGDEEEYDDDDEDEEFTDDDDEEEDFEDEIDDSALLNNKTKPNPVMPNLLMNGMKPPNTGGKDTNNNKGVGAGAGAGAGNAVNMMMGKGSGIPGGMGPMPPIGGQFGNLPMISLPGAVEGLPAAKHTPMMVNQPMMYARPPPAVNYMPPPPYHYPYPPPPPGDQYYMFSDENTASTCTLM